VSATSTAALTFCVHGSASTVASRTQHGWSANMGSVAWYVEDFCGSLTAAAPATVAAYRNDIEGFVTGPSGSSSTDRPASSG
jgi:hypothetical protein